MFRWKVKKVEQERPRVFDFLDDFVLNSTEKKMFACKRHT